ncbi:MAG: hypothetical protein DRP20_02325 [Thermotogae bacterium]|nr:MAG: hypothetical protein DRP20_02325 [Thermotogota bacterium]
MPRRQSGQTKWTKGAGLKIKFLSVEFAWQTVKKRNPEIEISGFSKLFEKSSHLVCSSVRNKTPFLKERSLYFRKWGHFLNSEKTKQSLGIP